MGYNRFYFNVALNSVLIFLFAFLCFYFLNTRQQPSTAAGMVILALLLTGRLIYLVNRTNRILGNFLMYLQDDDPSLSHSRKFVDRNFRGLIKSIEDLVDEYKKNRIELVVQAQYMETVLGNVSTGILSFNETGDVNTMNKAAVDYLGTGEIRHIKELDEMFFGLGTRMLTMRPWEQLTEKITSKGKVNYLSLSDAHIKIKGETIHIISLNDISKQMEEQEIESWKKLIRVINHEIMNSMTPIITLSHTIRKKLTKENWIKPAGARIQEDLKDAVDSVGIIEERSRGLVSFINRYKQLTTLPPLKISLIPIQDIFSKVEKLFGEELREKGIRFHNKSDCTYELEADSQMLEQVLINLVKNSVYAVRDVKNPEISMECLKNGDQRLSLVISDNGEGIPPDKIDQVFVPYFTTRKDGSGIGLSLCRQIIRIHNGQINIESKSGQGTSVTIKF